MPFLSTCGSLSRTGKLRYMMKLLFESVTKLDELGSSLSSHGQEAGHPSSKNVLQNRMTLFGKLINLFSIPSVERHPNCLFLLVGVRLHPWNILLSRPVATEAVRLSAVRLLGQAEHWVL